MQLIAHRGLINDNIKENTLEAFINAINNNYQGIELDIRLTKDKKIVVLHDKLINRTSNGKGNINNLTYKELSNYNFGTNKIKSKLPLLKDVIENINNKIIIIELKEEINEFEIDKILKLNNTNQYYLTSFNKKYIDNLKNINYKKGLINYVFNSNTDITKYDFLLVLESLFNKSIYNKLTNMSIEIILYGTLNNIKIKNKDIITNLKYII
ncbi:MAG: hypothetical protein IJD92_04275 [Bacilli bacterium]|nr:hypothetical protein [Bacilli bacterium]